MGGKMLPVGMCVTNKSVCDVGGWHGAGRPSRSFTPVVVGEGVDESACSYRVEHKP